MVKYIVELLKIILKKCIQIYHNHIVVLLNVVYHYVKDGLVLICVIHWKAEDAHADTDVHPKNKEINTLIES